MGRAVSLCRTNSRVLRRGSCVMLLSLAYKLANAVRHPLFCKFGRELTGEWRQLLCRSARLIWPFAPEAHHLCDLFLYRHPGQQIANSFVDRKPWKYGDDSRAEKIVADLKAVKDWSERNHVPIFLGEFGSFNKYSTLQDRCRHAPVVYSALGRLKIPNAWWEWDGGFNMFDAGTTRIADCMRRAIDLYYKN